MTSLFLSGVLEQRRFDRKPDTQPGVEDRWSHCWSFRTVISSGEILNQSDHIYISEQMTLLHLINSYICPPTWRQPCRKDRSVSARRSPFGSVYFLTVFGMVLQLMNVLERPALHRSFQRSGEGSDSWMHMWTPPVKSLMASAGVPDVISA